MQLLGSSKKFIENFFIGNKIPDKITSLAKSRNKEKETSEEEKHYSTRKKTTNH